jgi:hypothetical protein
MTGRIFEPFMFQVELDRDDPIICGDDSLARRCHVDRSPWKLILLHITRKLHRSTHR